MSETGAVKFQCEHHARELPQFPGMDELKAFRALLRERGLLGVDANGIGFGNVSLRAGLTSDFYITGSGTGGRPELKARDFARVTAWDFERNWLRCEGETIASSESLTHAAIYATKPEVKAVIHVHSAEGWKRLLDLAPTTSKLIEYGTPAMAREVSRLLQTTRAAQEKFLVMGGHAEGLLAFGATVMEAMSVLAARLGFTLDSAPKPIPAGIQ